MVHNNIKGLASYMEYNIALAVALIYLIGLPDSTTTKGIDTVTH